MYSRATVIMAVAALFAVALATPDMNSRDRTRNAAPHPGIAASSECAAPRLVREPGDIPAGYKPGPAPVPTQGEPPQVIVMTDGETPAEPRPLWEDPDAEVFSGSMKGPSPAGSERMIAYDQTKAGILFAGFVVSNGDTARIYRSTDGGNNWAYWRGVQHPGHILSSLELVVAEGESSFVFLFFKSSAGDGDAYVARFGLTTGSAVYSIKVDSDVIANLAACRDIEDPYYLYVTFETHGPEPYNMYVWRSTDYGKTWEDAGGTIVDTQTPPKPDICYGNSGNVYAVCRDFRQTSIDSVSFRLKRSTNRGETWLGSSQAGTPLVPVYDGVVGAKHGTSGTVWLVHTRDMEEVNGKGLGVFYYYTTDMGENWIYGGDAGIGGVDTDNNEKFPSIACHWNTGSPTVCFALVPSESLMFTWSSGDNDWTTPVKVNSNRHTGNFAPQAGWKNIGTSSYSSVLYAGTGPSGLYFDAWSMTGLAEERPVATEPATSPVSVRPSPATSRAAIHYNLGNTGRVRVSVSDIAGREVAVPAQGTMAAGPHTAVWNCADVPAGVYLVRVETGTGSQTGSLVVSH